MKEIFGLAGILFILFVFVIVISGIMGLMENKAEELHFDDIEMKLDKYLARIEEDGYITTETKMQIIEEFNDNYTEVNVDGSFEKVEPGEKVYLSLQLINRNRSIYGGTRESFNETFIKEVTYMGY